MTTSVRVGLLAIALLGCDNLPQPPMLDMAADMAASPDLITAGNAPAGFGNPCTTSPECRGFPADRPPGFLGCASFVGVDYCTMPCGQSAAGALCWAGTTCTCVNHPGASGVPQTDCVCER